MSSLRSTTTQLRSPRTLRTSVLTRTAQRLRMYPESSFLIEPALKSEPARSWLAVLPVKDSRFNGVAVAKTQRNVLVLDFVRMVEEIQPKFFLMENVGGLLTKHGKPFLREDFSQNIAARLYYPSPTS